MGLAIATTKAERAPRGLLGSRITRLIFVCNLLGLGVLSFGVLVLSELRAGLIQAQVSALELQGGVIANLLTERAIIDGFDGRPQLSGGGAGRALLELVPQTRALSGTTYQGPRIRVFDANGALAADTAALHGGIDEQPLPTQVKPVANPVAAAAEGMRGLMSALETWRLTPWRPTITLEEERATALSGQIAAGQRLDERNQRVISVTIPLQRVGLVVGAVTLESAEVERILLAERTALLPFILSAAVVTCLSSILLALFIARPLRQLANAADRVRLSGATRMELADIRHRKDEIGDLAHALEDMTGALAERIDANERFAADVSHEIKNPLTSIRSAVETARAVADAGDRERLLGIIAADVKRLDRLITDMTRASRLEAETARGEWERIDLGELLGHLAQSYDALADGRAAVVFEPGDVEALVKGQPGPIAQVFLNLIDNARSFSPPGGVVRLRTAALQTRGGRFIRAIVEDDGPGIPPGNLETIFQRLYTDRPKGAAFGGNSGLGLSIARQIIEAHEGRIYAENRAGGPDGGAAGARLIVELPAAVAAVRT